MGLEKNERRCNMTRWELVLQVSKHHNLTTAQARNVVDVFFDTISQALADGRRVELRNFGVFCAKTYPNCNRGSLQTGEILKRIYSFRVRFKTGRQLQYAINRQDRSSQ